MARNYIRESVILTYASGALPLSYWINPNHVVTLSARFSISPLQGFGGRFMQIYTVSRVAASLLSGFSGQKEGKS